MENLVSCRIFPPEGVRRMNVRSLPVAVRKDRLIPRLALAGCCALLAACGARGRDNTGTGSGGATNLGGRGGEGATGGATAGAGGITGGDAGAGGGGRGG